MNGGRVKILQNISLAPPSRDRHSSLSGWKKGMKRMMVVALRATLALQQWDNTMLVERVVRDTMWLTHRQQRMRLPWPLLTGHRA